MDQKKYERLLFTQQRKMTFKWLDSRDAWIIQASAYEPDNNEADDIILMGFIDTAHH